MRYEFPKLVKLERWLKVDGKCERCGAEIRPGNGPEYHHKYKPAREPGSNTLDNCEVLCRKPCHATITAMETIPQQSKNKRVFEKRIRARQSRRGFRRPGGVKFDWSRGSYRRSTE
jgi:5-methylcytosine-specific restriction protein A